MLQLVIMGVPVLGAWLFYRRFVAEAKRLQEKSCRAQRSSRLARSARWSRTRVTGSII